MTDIGDMDLTPLQEGFTQLHETYLAAIEAGFTEEQAMAIVLTVLTGALAIMNAGRES